MIYYRRDGAGAKIRKENSAGSTWDYVGECIYLNGQLYQLAQGEGRITYEGSYRYEFQYKDHLGNLRLAFRDSAAAPVSGVYAPPVLVQINNYLPFGGRAVGLDYELTNKDQHTYGSKERQDDFGINLHDFEARMSDPTIGNRFLSQDMLSELSRRFSPYVYTYSNPINFIDPDGMIGRKIKDFDGNEHEIGENEVINLYTEDEGDKEKSKTPKTQVKPDDKKVNEPSKVEPIPVVRHRWDLDPATLSDNSLIRKIQIALHQFGLFPGFGQIEGVVAKVGTATLGSQGLKSTLPAWKKVGIDMEHILSGHVAGGSRVSNLKTLFPNYMSNQQIEGAIRNAYQNVGKKLQTQGDRILLQGKTDNGLTIEMWLNKTTKTIETAYPKY